MKLVDNLIIPFKADLNIFFVVVVVRVLALPPPDPEQPPGQDELERRLPGYRRIVIPRESTLIELLVCVYLASRKENLTDKLCRF